VRYVLEGSVRKAGSRVRLTAQLIDAASGAHLWADRFDGTLEDIFDLQDQVTASVVGAIGPRLEQAEMDRAKRKPTESLVAYDYYLRGIASSLLYTKEGTSEAQRLFYKAIELDPDFAAAYGMAAWCFVHRKTHGWMENRPREIAETARLCRQAVERGSEDAVALSWGGFALAYVVHEVDDGAAYLERALVLNPNLAMAWGSSGWLQIYLGNPENALERLERSLRLNPLDPLSFRVQAGFGYAHFFSTQYEEAADWAGKALRMRPNYLTAVRGAAASHALAGRLNEAQKFMTQMRGLDPVLRIVNLNELLPLRRQEHFDRWREGLRLAGLPE
jgi:tetratricopeptide (TPR) repeat protein